ncbi:hypothetical protein KR018_007615, partial [Drosophila ironensis]
AVRARRPQSGHHNAGPDTNNRAKRRDTLQGGLLRPGVVGSRGHGVLGPESARCRLAVRPQRDQGLYGHQQPG